VQLGLPKVVIAGSSLMPSIESALALAAPPYGNRAKEIFVNIRAAARLRARK
jgi:hypothetical protein